MSADGDGHGVSAAGHLSANLRRLRASLGLSQAALAAACGTQAQRVGEWERGEVSPTVRSLDAVAQALGVEPHELLEPPS